MDFKNTLEKRCENDVWPIIFVLSSGTLITVSSEFIVFKEDFFEFDRIKANVELKDISNSGNIPRYVRIPYNSIAFFTEASS